MKKAWAKKIAPRTLGVASIVYSIFQKGMNKKIAPGILRFISIISWIFEKGMSKKIAPGILWVASILFECDLFFSMNGGLYVFFYKYCYF